MTASLLQSQYAQGETENNERFSTPAVHIILGSDTLKAQQRLKLLKLTIGSRNLLNIKTFLSSKRFFKGSCGRSWGGGGIWKLRKLLEWTWVRDKSLFPLIIKIMF